MGSHQGHNLLPPPLRGSKPPPFRSSRPLPSGALDAPSPPNLGVAPCRCTHVGHLISAPPTPTAQWSPGSTLDEFYRPGQGS